MAPSGPGAATGSHRAPPGQAGTGKLGQPRPQQLNGKPTVNRPVRSRYASNKRGMPRHAYPRNAPCRFRTHDGAGSRAQIGLIWTPHSTGRDTGVPIDGPA
jgi:hypothetical protein